MHIIDCALHIQRTPSGSRAIQDVVVNVSSVESEGDRLESAIFAGAGDGAKNMILILLTEQGMEFQVPLALPTMHEELELAHFWTNRQNLSVAILPDGSPEPYTLVRRSLPLESYFSQTAAYDFPQVSLQK